MRRARIFGEPADGFIAIRCPGCGCMHVIATVKPFSNGATWSFNGNFTKPTFTPSLLIRTGKYVPGHEDYDDEGYNLSQICHSFITDGKIKFLDDCTHALKGLTVDLPDVDIIKRYDNSTLPPSAFGIASVDDKLKR